MEHFGSYKTVLGISAVELRGGGKFSFRGHPKSMAIVLWSRPTMLDQNVLWTENNPNSVYLKLKFTSLFKQCLNLRKVLVNIVEPEVQLYNLDITYTTFHFSITLT